MPAHHFKGYLIAIEGIDGAGKTTQAHFVQNALQKRNLTVVRTKEPTTGQYGQILRDSALTGRLSLEEEVETFIKDRREHVETRIIPHLREGHVVIIDRYYFSSMAYQGARGMDPNTIMAQNEQFAPEPDLLVLLDVKPKLGLQRIRLRGDRANHFETTDTLEKAREIFKSIKKPYLYTVNAEQDPDSIRDLIVRQFTLVATQRIGRSVLQTDPKKALGETMKIVGGTTLED